MTLPSGGEAAIASQDDLHHPQRSRPDRLANVPRYKLLNHDRD